MPYIVEKGIPAPRTFTGNRSRIYPFNVMDVGDSFGITSPEEAKRVTAAANHYGRNHAGLKFSILKHEGAWRCWRLA